MPDAIRDTGGSRKAQPRRGGFRIAVAVCAVLCAGHAQAQERAIPDDIRRLDDSAPGDVGISLIDAYLDAFAQLDCHEIAALALTLAILCFAVVTAILLVRTRYRLART